MARTHHVLMMTGAVMVCLLGTLENETLFASEDNCSLSEASSSSPLRANAAPETPMSTSAPAPDISVDARPAGTDSPFHPLPQIEPSRFVLDSGLFAANPSPGPAERGAQRPFNLLPAASSAFAGQIYQGRPYRTGTTGRGGSIAALMIGAAATITGAAILVYANRPECDIHQFAGGCGYGPKVVGGAVLSGGIVGLFVGAVTW